MRNLTTAAFSTTLLLLGCLSAAHAQDPMPLLSASGCHVYFLESSQGQVIATNPGRTVGEGIFRRQKDGRTFHFQFEVVAVAALCAEPDLPFCERSQHVTTIRFSRNGRWVTEMWTFVQTLDDPLVPTKWFGEGVSQVIKGNYYKHGSSGLRFELDLATGAVTYPKGTFVYCREQPGP